MTLRQIFGRLAALIVVGSAALGSAAASAQSEAERDLLYAALCVGIVWPDGSETRVAGPVAADELDLRLRGDALMAAAERAAPALSARLVQEAADGADWHGQMAMRDPGLAAAVEGECVLFLDSFLPPLH